MRHFSNWKVTEREELKLIKDERGIQVQKHSWNPTVKN